MSSTIAATISSSSSSITAAGVIAGIVVLAIWIWLAVVVVQFLRVMTKAAHRYLEVTPPPPMSGPERGPEPGPQPVPGRGYS
jgi:hypothetical protein